MSREQIDIVGTVEDCYGVRLDELRSPSRRPELVRARAELVYLYRRHTGLTLAQVGLIIGGRTPATVHHLWDKYYREKSFNHRIHRVKPPAARTA